MGLRTKCPQIWYGFGTGTQHIVEFYLSHVALQRQQHRSQRPRLPPVTTQGPPPTSNRTAPCRPPMSSPSPESVSLLQGCGDSSPSPSTSPARDSAYYFGEESARAELSLEPRSPPAPAPLEREVEQLKAQVAYWQQHCLDAEVEVKRLRVLPFGSASCASGS